MSEMFERFVPKQFLTKIARSGIENIELGRADVAEVSILFADVRGFTAMSESLQPQELLNFLNAYLQRIDKVIHDHDGFIDKFIGDGVMALFGLNENSKTASRMALNAARSMSKELEIMNENLKSDLPAPLRIGIGIHVGQVIVGQMGYGIATSITAIGDPVNTASRLESLTKEYSCQLIFSDKVANLVAEDFSELAHESTEIRGRVEPLGIYIVEDAQRLPYFTV
jgi:adenylate cyclase